MFSQKKKNLLIAVLDSALFSGDLVYSQFFPNLFVCPLRPMKIRHFSKETRGSNPFLVFYGLAGLAYDVSNSNYLRIKNPSTCPFAGSSAHGEQFPPAPPPKKNRRNRRKTLSSKRP